MAARTDATPMRRIKQATKKNEDRKKMVRRLKKKSKQTFEAVYVVLFVLLCIAGSLGVARRRPRHHHQATASLLHLCHVSALKRLFAMATSQANPRAAPARLFPRPH